MSKPGRKNGRDNDGDGRFGPNDGVDLNRNYPFKWGLLGEDGSTRGYALHTYRGPRAGSEPETKALMQLANREVLAAAISYHVGGVAMLVPYTIDRVKSPEPNDAWAVAEHVAERMPPHPDATGAKTFPVRRRLYPVDGTDQDWHRAAHGTVAFLVEGGLRASAASPVRRVDLVRAIRGSWMALADRYLDGPSIEGRVLDARGRPVVAEVHLANVRFFEGESWRSRCRDGLFARFVPEPGRYVLRVRLPRGQQVLERPVSIGRARLQITLRLDEAVPPTPCDTAAKVR